MENTTEYNTGLGVFEEKAFDFFSQAPEGDINLVEMMGNLLEEVVSPYAKECFLSDPEIRRVYNLKSSSQRVIINKYITSLLLLYRSLPNAHRVDLIISLLANDGFVEDWLKVFRFNILLFIKDYKIFETLYYKESDDASQKQ